jgi:hypothetical protein
MTMERSGEVAVDHFADGDLLMNPNLRLTPLRSMAVAAIAAAAVNVEIARANPPCPSGTFQTTQHHCDCPPGTTKNYHDAFKWYADCRAQTPPPPPGPPPACPSGTFETTQHHCDCPPGTTKSYHDAFKWYADCRAPSSFPVCPGGTFKTTEHHCSCPAGTNKYYHDVFKYTADCHVPGQPPTCPASGTFSTLGQNVGGNRGCVCPSGGVKLYTGIGNSQAECKLPTAEPVLTSFIPGRDGFPFDNPSQCGVGGGAGCCTGMSWASLGYFAASRPVPSSLTPPIDSWIQNATNSGVPLMAAEWSVNWAAHTADFKGVVDHVDHGVPLPLGLLTPQKDLSDNHSVVAYGYQIVDAANPPHRRVLIYDVDVEGASCSLFNFQTRAGERWAETCEGGEVDSDPAEGTDPEGSYWLGFWNEEAYYRNWSSSHHLP